MTVGIAGLLAVIPYRYGTEGCQKRGGRACPGFWRRSRTAMALSAARNVGTAVPAAG